MKKSRWMTIRSREFLVFRILWGNKCNKIGISRSNHFSAFTSFVRTQICLIGVLRKKRNPVDVYLVSTWFSYPKSEYGIQNFGDDFKIVHLNCNFIYYEVILGSLTILNDRYNYMFNPPLVPDYLFADVQN